MEVGTAAGGRGAATGAGQGEDGGREEPRAGRRPGLGGPGQTPRRRWR